MRVFHVGTTVLHMEHWQSINAGLAGAVNARLGGAGMSMRQASDRTGIALTTLSRRLTGTSPFSADELAALAKLFDTTVSGLAEEAEALVADGAVSA